MGIPRTLLTPGEYGEQIRNLCAQRGRGRPERTVLSRWEREIFRKLT